MASWLVIDWDQDQFHLLSVQSTRRGTQVARAVTWTHPEPFTPSTAERVGKLLREFLKNEKIAPAPVIVGIGRDRILLKELRIPPIAAHEEAALVRFQTAKELTEAVDNYAIDYGSLDPTQNSGERPIMTVAARREIVSMLQILCQAAGLKLHAVTPRLFGAGSVLAQAVLPDASPLTQNRRNVVLVLGQRWAELSFFRGGQLVQAQALAKGPLLLSEVRRNLAVFQAQHAVEVDVSGPECLYVFGEDAGALQTLQTGLNLPIVLLDPLGQDAVVSAQTTNPGAFAGALGLALLWSQPKAAPVNLSTPKRQQAPVSVGRQRGLIYGAAAAVAFFFLFGCGYYVLAQKKAEIEQLAKEKTEYEETFKKFSQERAEIEAYQEWEQTTVPWLDEIYDLSARMPSEVGFRINQLSASTLPKKSAKELKEAKDKGSKEVMIGRIDLSGITPGDKEIYTQQLHASMSRDPHVRPEQVRSKNASGEFQMKIDIAKQSADKYDTRLVVPIPQVEFAPSGKGSKKGPKQ